MLVLFAKEPCAGQVKTRMCPPLSLEQAAALYACLLGDTLSCSAEIAQALGLDFVVAIDPPEARSAFAERVPAGARILQQRGLDLSERLANAAADLAAEGARPILMRGSDSPAMDIHAVRSALAALERAGLVICPDRDGGYNLIGLREPVPALFDLPMSSGNLLDRTTTVAESLGVSWELLPAGFDLDCFEDLRRFAQREADAAWHVLCPRLCAYLGTSEMLELLGSDAGSA